MEFLVKWADNPGDHPDLWKRGMIASPIRPDGWEWGSEEVKSPANGGKFVRIRVPGVTPEEFEASCERELGRKPLDAEDREIDIGAGQPARQGAGSPSCRPAIRFDLDNFTAVEREMMRTGGARTVQKTDMEARLGRNGKSLAAARAERIARGGR